MANTKYDEIVQLTTEDIVEQLEEAKAQLGKMRFNHAVSPIEDGTQLKKLKKQIARLMTELRKRELAESK
ncbi:MAG: 50S ribosomal protein L29 [Bacteroidetes bacterium]|nr:50S ribosomal protein L29 [Bacteroidota bacterium]